MQLVTLVSQGLSSRQIAEALGISCYTVNNHRKNICRKLGVHSTSELVSRSVAIVAELQSEAAANARTEGEPIRTPDRCRRGVLVIDDDVGFISSLREMLSSAGYTVSAARDGSEALSILDERRSDLHLAIVDLVLPGSYSGFDLIGVLARRRHGMKIVAVSGILRGSELYVATRVGADAVIEKPSSRMAFPKEQWLHTVDRLLAGMTP